MRTERLDIRVNRNADYNETWQIFDNEGVPINITNMDVDMYVRLASGVGSVIAEAVITKNEPEVGIFTILLSGDSFNELAVLSQVDRLAYDIRVTYSDGVRAVPVSGLILLTPGVTY